MESVPIASVFLLVVFCLFSVVVFIKQKRNESAFIPSVGACVAMLLFFLIFPHFISYLRFGQPLSPPWPFETGRNRYEVGVHVDVFSLLDNGFRWYSELLIFVENNNIYFYAESPGAMLSIGENNIWLWDTSHYLFHFVGYSVARQDSNNTTHFSFSSGLLELPNVITTAIGPGVIDVDLTPQRPSVYLRVFLPENFPYGQTLEIRFNTEVFMWNWLGTFPLTTYLNNYRKESVPGGTIVNVQFDSEVPIAYTPDNREISVNQFWKVYFNAFSTSLPRPPPSYRPWILAVTTPSLSHEESSVRLPEGILFTLKMRLQSGLPLPSPSVVKIVSPIQAEMTKVGEDEWTYLFPHEYQGAEVVIEVRIPGYEPTAIRATLSVEEKKEARAYALPILLGGMGAVLFLWFFRK